MATAALIREQLQKTQRYYDDCCKAQEDEDTDPPDFDAKCDALVPVLTGELKAHFHCHRADDIFTAIRIAKEFSLDYVLVHCTEGHLIAEEPCRRKSTGHHRAADDHPLQTGAEKRDRQKPRHLKSAWGQDRHLHRLQRYADRALADLCRNGGARGNGHRCRHWLPSPSILPRSSASRNRVGSLKTGKDADFAVFAPDCDPLTIAAKPELVVVNGKIVRR